MLTFELLKLLAKKTKVGPVWIMVWDRWSLEIFSTSNYFMLLGSITTGPPIPERGSDARGSQVTPGTGRRFYLGLGQPHRCFPSRDAQEISRYPSRHLTQSSRRGCPGHHGWGSMCSLERRPPEQLPLPREQVSRSSPLLGHFEPKRSPTRGRAPQLPPGQPTTPSKGKARGAWACHWKGRFLGSDLRAVRGVQKPRILPSPEKGPSHRGQKVLCCF